jgi:hypothetical protein
MRSDKNKHIYWSVGIGLALILILIFSRLIVLLIGISGKVTDRSQLLDLLQVMQRHDRHVMIVILNNNEIRYGGGFVGSIGYLSYSNNKIKLEPIRNVYYYDRTTAPLAYDLPELTMLGAHGVQLRDAAHSLSWDTNASRLGQMFAKTTGQPVDAVLAITPDFVKSLLKQTGPVTLDNRQQVNADNFFEVVQKEVETGQDAQSGQDAKGSTFAEIANKLVARLQQTSPVQLGDLEKLFREEVADKHIALFSSEQQLSQFADETALSQKQTCKLFDCLLVAESNGGADKSSSYMKSNMQKHSTINSDGSVINTIKIRRVHSADSYLYPYIEAKGGLPNWLVKRNISSIKIAVPTGSTLVSSQGSDDPIITSNEEGFTTFTITKTLDPTGAADMSLTYKLPSQLAMTDRVVFAQQVDKQFGGWPYSLQLEVQMPSSYHLELSNTKNILLSDDNIVIKKLVVDQDSQLQLEYVRNK